jgi:hypothetical protein
MLVVNRGFGPGLVPPKQGLARHSYSMASFGASKHQTEQRLPRAVKVKNKQPADRQITAEQLLREAKEIQLEDDFKKPKTMRATLMTWGPRGGADSPVPLGPKKRQ